jgi:hypothetical protein
MTVPLLLQFENVAFNLEIAKRLAEASAQHFGDFLQFLFSVRPFALDYKRSDVVCDGGGYALRVSPFGFQILAGLSQEPVAVCRYPFGIFGANIARFVKRPHSPFKNASHRRHAPGIEHVSVNETAERLDRRRKIVDHRVTTEK